MSNPELIRISRVRTFQDTKLNSPKYRGQGLRSMIYESREPSLRSLSQTLHASILRGTGELGAPVVEVLNMDTLEAAESLVLKGLNPLVLCYADDKLPGGFVSSGAGAQEEEIWRRTNIARIMEEESHLYYPLKWNELL